MSEILKKITTKDVLGDDFKPATEAEKGPQRLYLVIGVASAVIPDETNYGQYYRYIGSFEAERLSDKVKFSSGVCILPEPIGTMVGSQLLEVVKPEDVSEETSEDNKGNKKTRKRYKVPSAQFAFVIGIKPSKKGGRGYEWTCEPIVQPRESDALADLRKVVDTGMKALPVLGKPEETKAATPAKK